MTAARVWLSIYLAAFSVLAGLLIQTLTTPIPYGDVSRVGRISERSFGWRVAQPFIDPSSLVGVPIEKADILVIGDSFASTHVWQSRLGKAGYGVATVFWDALDEGLCSDFGERLADSKFHGRLVIIESVERYFAVRMDKSTTCTHMRKPLTASAAVRAAPAAGVPGFALNWNAQLIAGWLTMRCTTAVIEERTLDECNAQAVSRPVEDGCDRFSHRRCDRTLLLANDELFGEITARHVADMQAIGARHPSIPILWMVLPNKWTTYVDPMHSQSFVTALAQSGLGPDFFGFTQTQKMAMRDFYLPNDSHISPEGQIALGDLMARAVQQKLAASAAAAATDRPTAPARRPPRRSPQQVP